MFKKFQNVLPIAFFVGVIVFFFSPVIFRGKLPVPTDTLVGLYHPWRDLYADQYPRGIPFKNFLITDPIRQQIPWRKMGIDELKRGNTPMWNPYSFAGTPLLGNIQSGLLYPLNFVFFIFSFQRAWTMLIVLQPLLAGIFLYLYLSSKGLHPIASLISSIAWSFSGFSIAWLTWGTIVHTALWLPIFLLCIDQLFKKNTNIKSVSWSILLGVSLASSFFAGHVQIFLYCFIAAIGYGIYQYLSLTPKQKNIRVIIPFLIAIGVFIFLSFFEWSQLYSLILNSSRVEEENLLLKEGWFLPIRQLIQFFIPDYFGNPATLNYWGVWNYGELIGYIGVLPLLFAGIGIWYSRFRDRMFWLAVLILSGLFVLPSPLSKLPYILHIPLWSTLQPTRLLVLVVFSLIIFCAHGISEVIVTSRKKPFSLMKPLVILFCFFVSVIVFTQFVSATVPSVEVKEHMNIASRNSIFPFAIFLFGVVTLLFIQKKIFTRFALLGLVVLIVIDLLRFANKFTPFTEAAYFFPETKIISFLKNQPKPFRVLATDDRIFPPNVLGYYGIESISGYDPLYSRYFEAIVVANNRKKADLTKPYGFNRIVIPQYTQTSITDMLGINYVVTFGPSDLNGLEYVMNEGQTYLYKSSAKNLRLFFSPEVIPVSSLESAISTLYESKTPQRTVVVQANIQSIANEPLIDKETITITSYEQSFISLKVFANVQRYLVILNSYFPGWIAMIDGVVTPIYQTNGAFMGIVVPKGEHTIQLQYEGV